MITTAHASICRCTRLDLTRTQHSDVLARGCQTLVCLQRSGAGYKGRTLYRRKGLITPPGLELHPQRYAWIGPCSNASGKAHDHPIPCSSNAVATDPSFRCGLYDIPLDWAHPELGTGQMRYVKYAKGCSPAQNGYFYDAVPEEYTLEEWFNDFARTWYSDLSGQYDLVAFDARGQGDYEHTDHFWHQ
ncbi:hypothetical protein FKP32DRAFT_261961 [Trametes sanguinea]|nr:hypothetical protein FKP32DRAFT_261961 [Trametes sanguinea]